MIKSMTGFASLQGTFGQYNWTWEIRTVNARGFEARLRLPDWMELSDQLIRRELAKTVKRGSVTVTAKAQSYTGSMEEQLDVDVLKQRISQIAEIETEAEKQGVALANSSAAYILMLRGVLTGEGDEELKDLRESMLQGLPELMAQLDNARKDEGTALEKILNGQIDWIESLLADAGDLAEARSDRMADRLRERLARVLDPGDVVDDARLEQEIALIAVKADVTEEIDRLKAHVSSARDLLASHAAAGRRLDFLAQEFNREANTLCAKAQSPDLSRLGLDLKATIDQMREQLQNVE